MNPALPGMPEMSEPFASLWKTLPIPGEFDSMDALDQARWKDVMLACFNAGRTEAWQPIETAPSGPVLATWATTWPKAPHIEVCERGELGGWFYSYDGDAPNDEPTHWMPLPSAPTPPAAMTKEQP